MYSDRRRHVLAWAAAAVIALALVLGLAVWALSGDGQELERETEYAITETIRRSALQCFAVEGVYPESLDYLVENYGLRVNTTDYYVVYEVFADNLPPEVRVVKKES